MHNIKDIRKNLKEFKKKLSDRNFDFKVSEFEKLDNNNRKLISEKENLEQQKKILSKSKDKSNFEKSKKISEEISKIYNKQSVVQKKLNDFLNFIPNLALDDVPIGKNEMSNKIIKKFGNIKEFSFNPKSHTEIGIISKEIDFDTSIKLSGSRFVVLKIKWLYLKELL